MSENRNVKLIGAGLALGVLVTLAIIGVVSLVGDDAGDSVAPADQQAESDTSREALTPIAPEETRRLLEDALAETMGDDPQWAADTEAAVLEAFADEPDLASAEEVDVNCSAQLCRLTAVLPGAAADPAVLDLVLFTAVQRLAPILPRTLSETAEQPDDALRLNLWLARDGYYLPTEGGGPIE